MKQLILATLAALLCAFAVPAFADQTATVIWVDLVGEDGYVIERKDSNCVTTGTFNVIGTVAANVVTFTDVVHPTGAQLCYRIAGTLNGVQGLYSNEATITIPPPLPAPLINVVTP